jgi:hypothetical protein
VLLINVGVYLALLATLLRRLQPIPGLIAAALVALDSSLLVWTLHGFETTLQAVFTTLAVLSFLGTGSARLAPIWAALAFVVRPDALVVFAWAALLMVRRRELRWTLPASAVLVVGVFVFQRVYYGDWLPNTLYLKATPGAEAFGRGSHYLGRFALGDFFSFPLMLAPLALVILRRDLWAICALPIVWTLCVVGIGGDVFEHGQFFAPIIPTLAVLTGLLLEHLWLAARVHRAARYALVAVALMLVVHLARAIPLLLVTTPAFNAEPLISTLIAIPPGSLIGEFAAGIVPYYLPEQRFHDFLGNSDRRIARSPAKPGPPGHNKWDYGYSLGEVRPDFLVTAAPFGGTDEQYRSELAAGRDYAFHPALWLDERFRRDYRRFAGRRETSYGSTHAGNQHLSPR